ncbi:hypothetical protein M5E87_26805 [Flavonifractor plautii]|nr:hypothetical protein M5E87_26805 [Flavonifractor plautii]
MLGFPMLDARGSGFSPDWEDYPMFNWAQASLERAVGVAYEQRFRSLLAYVNDRPQAIEALLGARSGRTTIRAISRRPPPMWRPTAWR